MPGNVQPVADEREGLVQFLAHQRHVLRLTAYGLTDEQARLTPTVSELSVGGLIKHVTRVEDFWIAVVLQRQAPFDLSADWSENFRLGPDETLDRTLDDYAATARVTGSVIDSIADLGQPVPVPGGMPWLPDDVDAWSVRWVLLHLIQETARHAGHADIVREAIDGATAYPLMAAAEHWPETPWMKAWEPAS